MTIDPQVLSLIAVGAAVAANCQPCLERTAEMAHKQGADKEQIAKAIEVGRRVRMGAASKMDEFAVHLQDRYPAAAAGVEGACGCAHGSPGQIARGA